MLIYRLFLIVLTPLVALRLLLALFRRRETFAGLRERMSLGAGPASPGHPYVWVHGASLGELTSARRMIDRILATNSRLHILVTCNSYTARDMVRTWSDAGRIEVRLAPLDAPLIVANFLGRWHPIALITLENEIWPSRIVMAAHEGLPVMVVGGRMSPRSAATWARFGPLARQVMGAVSCLAPVDPENGARFVKLGLAPERLCDPINLKASVELRAPGPDKLAQLARIFERGQTILAASTHDGEDELIIQAFERARSQREGLRLILVPRHPERADAIARLIKTAGLSFARRSRDQLPGPDDPVYLADTIGEMALFYSLAGVTIVAGSFQPHGGHSPVEAIQFGSVVVHGPDVSNHKKMYQALHKAQACFAAAGGRELAEILVTLGDFEKLNSASEKAKKAAAKLNSGDAETDQIISRLAPLIRHHPVK